MDQFRMRYYSLEGLRMVLHGVRDNPSPHHILRSSIDSIEFFLREVEQDADRWGDFVPNLMGVTLIDSEPPLIKTAVERFLTLNRTAIDNLERYKEEEVVASALDDRKLDSFVEECKRGWDAQNWLEKLLEQRGQLRAGANMPSSGSRFFRFLAPKDMFVLSSYELPLGFGRGYGSELAQYVTRHLISVVESQCHKVPPADLDAVVSETMRCIRSLDDPMVIVFGSIELENRFLEHRDFDFDPADSALKFGNDAYLAARPRNMVCRGVGVRWFEPEIGGVPDDQDLPAI